MVHFLSWTLNVQHLCILSIRLNAKLCIYFCLVPSEMLEEVKVVFAVFVI